jgi:glycogen operon protein
MGAEEKCRFTLTKNAASNNWEITVPTDDIKKKGIATTVFYGLRAWGPNWPFVADWSKGSDAGFSKDVDDDGNRFNPNKLLTDPYALELSHDPLNAKNLDGTVYASGPENRKKDSGPFAPKGIVLKSEASPSGNRPTRPFKDEIIYEVHVRGLTKQDSSVPAAERGTYAGAARKVDYFKNLGITAVEFLPVHEFCNEQNDVPMSPDGQAYWGYGTLGFFAPDRRYASDQSPGGPTREFKAMVKAFHDSGIKVYLDVVYNHTGEGGPYQADQPNTANILSWRGLDNPTYYELTNGNQFYYDNTGTSGNFNCANPVVRNLILDSLSYWTKQMNVDGFRFDLAPVLGNRFDHQQANGEGFSFDKLNGDNALNRAVKELPVRPATGGAGVDLIAEPWTASGDGGQQQGNFPWGWAEWNDHFRDSFRKSQNKLGVEVVTPGELATRFAGSRDLYQDDGRKPWSSINYIISHDGPTLRDLYSYNNGPNAWDQSGDKSLQRQAARNGFAFPLLSVGVPMFTGGDEMYRTQNGQINPYNIDSPVTWLNWNDLKTNKNHFDFARRAVAFRRAHSALRPAEYFDGNDHNNNGLKDITWYRDNGAEPDNAYWTATDRHFLAYRIDGTEFKDPARSIYVAYNGWREPVVATLPKAGEGKAWYRVADTASWMEKQGNFNDPGSEEKLNVATYEMKGRTVLILIEK